MKKKILLSLVIVSMLVCLFAISASALDLTDPINGIYYSVFESNGVYTASVNSNNVNCELEIVNIPETVAYNGKTYKVTAIDGNAFSGSNPKWAGNKVTKEVYIPATVTSIGEHVFRNCTALTKVKILGSDASFSDAEFFSCSSLVEVDLSGMTKLDSMGQYCFYGCTKLTTLKLPNCLKEINGGENFLRNCSSLTSIVIPDSVTKISDNSFQHASNLTSIQLPKNLVTLGCNNFQSSKITRIVLPNTLESVGKHIFHGSQVKTVVIASTNIDITKGNTPTNMFDGSNVSLIFYAGEKEADARTFASQFAKIKNWTNYISYDEYLNNPVEANYTNTIVYGTLNCANCSELSKKEATFKFTNFISEMKDSVACTCGEETVVKSYAPILVLDGWSAKIDGDRVCLSYTINKSSLAVYEEKTSKEAGTVKFGVVAAAVADGTTQFNPLNDDLTVANDKIVSVAVDREYASFDFILSGFTADYYEKLIVMCAYVYDGSEIYYVDSVSNTYATPFTFSSLV